jgi:hypothetical protein
MKRPKQLPAVDRHTKTAAVPAGAGGVRPSIDWGQIAGVALPALASIF